MITLLVLYLVITFIFPVLWIMFVKAVCETPVRFKIKPMFAWYDVWIGSFIDWHKGKVYIFPIPMFGIRIEMEGDVPNEVKNLFR